MKRFIIPVIFIFVLIFSLTFTNQVSAKEEAFREVKVAYTQTTGSGSNKEILAVASTDRVRVYGFCIYSGSSSTITLHLEGTAATGNILHKSTIDAGSGYVQDFQPNYVEGNPGQDIDLDSSASSTIWVMVWYELVPAPY